MYCFITAHVVAMVPHITAISAVSRHAVGGRVGGVKGRGYH